MSDIGGTTKANTLSATSYYANATVKQLDRNNNPIRTYKLEGLWPTTLDAIDLSYDANDAVEEFGATFRFNWMTIAGAGAGGSIIFKLSSLFLIIDILKSFNYEHPFVEPHVLHFIQVPFLTKVKLPHSPQASPS